MSTLHELFDVYGQSPWIDNIRRDWIEDGTLARLVADGARGVTSNPAIFAKAFQESTLYDSLVTTVNSDDPEVVFESLAIADVRDACDILLPVFHDAVEARRQGARRYDDGFVSLEVSPRLAHDGPATTAAALRLWREVNRANLMVKIPATTAGLSSIEDAIRHGVNVNVTLIFSVDRYRDVLLAWRQGLAAALREGRSIDSIASVASFFVSRVDAAVDPLLPEGDPRRGTVATAQVAAAYAAFGDFMTEPQTKELLDAGAQIQRPLWASTSTKNPSYPDLLYVDSIVGNETVNTMPDATFAATLDHGHFSQSLLLSPARVAAASAVLESLPSEIDLGAITEKLEHDGVASFVASYGDLLELVAAKLARS